MFKRNKKSDLPARPSPPSAEEMKEDLSAAPFNDIVFTLFRTDFMGIEPLDTSIAAVMDEKIEDVPIDIMFRKAVAFVEINDELKNKLSFVQKSQSSLKIVTTDLQEAVEHVKSQALIAIDGGLQ